MFLQQWAYLDYNLYGAGYPGHMHQDRNIERCEEECVTIYIRVANCRFGTSDLQHGQHAAQMAFCMEMALVLVLAVCIGQAVLQPFLCVFSESADSMRCHFGHEGIRSFRYNKASLGIFELPPVSFYAHGTQLPASSLLGLWYKVSWSGIVFPLLWHMKTLLSPFWPYSMPGACRTVSAGPYLLVLP